MERSEEQKLQLKLHRKLQKRRRQQRKLLLKQQQQLQQRKQEQKQQLCLNIILHEIGATQNRDKDTRTIKKLVRQKFVKNVGEAELRQLWDIPAEENLSNDLEMIAQNINNFEIEKDILYFRLPQSDVRKLVLPSAQAQQVLEVCHVHTVLHSTSMNSGSSKAGPSEAVLDLKSRFWWPSMTNQIEAYPHNCLACKKIQNLEQNTKTVAKPPESFASPPKHLDSAPKTVAKPPKTFESLPKHLDSAPKTFAKPPKSFASPPKYLDSAPKTVANPPKNFASPPKHLDSAPKTVAKPSKTYESPPKNSITPQTANWSCDLVSFNVTSGAEKYNHIIIMVEYSILWLEIFPIPDCNAETIRHAIYSEFVPRHGMGSTLYTDATKPKVSQIFREACQGMREVTHKIVAFNAGSNSAERCHKLIKNLFPVMLDQLGLPERRWAKLIPALLLAYRTTPLKSCKLTPFYLTYGVHPIQGTSRPEK